MCFKMKAGAAMISILFITAILTPLIATADPSATNLLARLSPPGEFGLLGTDHLGRDVFSRLLYGARLSVIVSIVTLFVSLALGVTLGLIAGYFKICDNAVMYVMEVLLAFPSMILSLAIVSIAGAGLFNAVIAVCLVSWIGYARLVRGMTMSLKERDFVKAARISGTGDFGIMIRHILPNVLNPVIIFSVTNISAIMMQLAGLSFLGLGVQPPTAEWGAMLNDARGYITTAPWLTIAPGTGLVFMITGFNLFGEGLAQYIGKGDT
jgi:peptide/nickel transport system permease protein